MKYLSKRQVQRYLNKGLRESEIKFNYQISEVRMASRKGFHAEKEEYWGVNVNYGCDNYRYRELSQIVECISRSVPEHMQGWISLLSIEALSPNIQFVLPKYLNMEEN